MAGTVTYPIRTADGTRSWGRNSRPAAGGNSWRSRGRSGKDKLMADAVIVAAARSPIGRAFKGSLKELRPDDLTVTIVRAALDKVPQLDPSDVDDLMLCCCLPGGEAGFKKSLRAS